MLRTTSLRVGGALMALLLTAGTAMAGKPTFVSPLDGEAERPVPVITSATGNAIFKISADETSITYKLIVANIDDVTQAHIHCGTPDVAGPVVVFLYGLGPTVTTNGILAQGTITAEDVIPRPDSPACPGGVADLDDVIEKIRSGGAYSNVHTVEWPGGEIRGTIR